MAPGEIRVASAVRATVGEAPLWSTTERALYWIDGHRRVVFRLRDGVTEERELPFRPSCLVPDRQGGLVVGYKKGLGRFEFESGRAEQWPLSGVDFSDVSFNDAACDAAGRLWIGTRHAGGHAPVAALYSIGPDLRPVCGRRGLVVSNGIAFSPDGRRMYHADSRPGRVDAYDLDPATGMLGAPQCLIDYTGNGFRPDGCTVDEEGFLWVAEIEGWRIARYAPDGQLDRAIALPVAKPSSLAFGGPGLRTLFVTTISYGLDAAALAAQPAAGCLLALEPGVAGLPEHAFRADLGNVSMGG
ncbi:SMP-30/gluconolactonase/LRE family protein [Roseomonas sp. AR75]|uniref:SMP-30/gluconolactonase/LRE family protein n=1 Tax=Roseomonas sp. AR75 TaxID=2562311 RepID=UPI0010BFB8B6|nr:SMP-30/gluconolactonase/LRE family protein [Roseomonas sp. AR75]